MDQVMMFSVLIMFSMLSTHTISTETAKSIIILAGQSNMSGRGGVNSSTWDGIVPPECQPSPMILRLSANLTWEEAREPLHKDIDTNKICGVGPGMPFANSLLKRDPSIGVIGLVPCAIGATSISDWSRGTNLYNQLLNRAQAALLNGGGLIRAILWYQGEADANATASPLYKGRFQKFIKDVRLDLQSPLLPVIEVALGNSSNITEVEIVRKAQLETAVELRNVECVDATGLPVKNGDTVHLSTTGQVELGTMMADAFLHIPYSH